VSKRTLELVPVEWPFVEVTEVSSEIVCLITSGDRFRAGMNN
jgi:hypothetical protein